MGRLISVLIPAYNEEGSIKELYNQIITSINKMPFSRGIDNYEIIFIDDGSTDNTAIVIKDLIKKDSRVQLISFRKNFGKSAALDAGFRYIENKNKDGIVFTMDADLQDDPREFSKFIEKIDEGYDLVVGWKYKRLDSAEKRIPSRLFNKVTSSLSGVKLHDHDCGFKCFRARVAESLNLYGELHRYIPVLAYRNGFRITEIKVEHHRREYGHSKYGLERYMRGALDSLTTNFLPKYSDRPMYLFGRLGIWTAFVGFVICIYLTAKWFMGFAIGTRPLLMLGVLLIVVGIQFVAIGFIGNLIVDVTRDKNQTQYRIKEII